MTNRDGKGMRILVRASILPFEEVDAKKAVFANTFWGNTGNLLFVYSLLRNIYTEDMVIDRYTDADEADADRINAEYDLFLIPLANAFRENWQGTLRRYTNLIKRLTIPCVVAGVGLQASYEPGLQKGFVFDDGVRDFVQAVLAHSASIGVRGEITAEYVRALGFPEDRIDVIGCPSMYLYGGDLPAKEIRPLAASTRISISRHVVHKDFLEFAGRVRAAYPDYYLIPQDIEDLRLLYAGIPLRYRGGWQPRHYETTVDAQAYRDDRIRMFVTVPAWIRFLQGMDLGIGSCIHGSVASLLAGNPTLVFPADARVRELVEYHHMAGVRPADLRPDTSLGQLYEAADFTQVRTAHKQCYAAFADFLRRNGIEPQPVSQRTDTAFDKKVDLSRAEAAGAVHTLYGLTREERIERIRTYSGRAAQRVHWCLTNRTDPRRAAGARERLPEWLQELNLALAMLLRFAGE